MISSILYNLFYLQYVFKLHNMIYRLLVPQYKYQAKCYPTPLRELLVFAVVQMQSANVYYIYVPL